MNHLCPLVDDLAGQVHILLDGRVAEDHAVLHDGALLDLHVSADDRVLHGAGDHAAVGNHRIPDGCGLIVVHRAGVRGDGVDWPCGGDELRGDIVVQKLHVGVIVAAEVGDRCKVPLVLNTPDVEIGILDVQDICQAADCRGLHRLAKKIDEQLALHDHGVHEDVLLLRGSEVPRDRRDALLAVELKGGAVAVGLLCVLHLLVEERDVCAALDVRL